MGGRYGNNFSHFHEARDPYAPSEEAINMFSIRCGRTIKGAIDSSARRAKFHNDAESILDQARIRESEREEQVDQVETAWETSESRQRLRQIEAVASAAAQISGKAKSKLETTMVSELEAILSASKDEIVSISDEANEESEGESH